MARLLRRSRPEAGVCRNGSLVGGPLIAGSPLGLLVRPAAGRDVLDPQLDPQLARGMPERPNRVRLSRRRVAPV